MSPVSPATGVAVGDVLHPPAHDVHGRSRVGDFLAWVAEHRGRPMSTHEELWRWSVEDLEGFWTAVWEFSEVRATPWTSVLEAGDGVEGARWFTGARLNYAEHALGRDEDADRLAVLGRSQTRDDVDLTFAELREQVGRAQVVLRELGVRPGDRVAGYLPNIPETVVAFLAVAGLGATWTSCASELGARSVLDRFAQVEPVVLLVAGGYRYGTKDVDRREQVAQVVAGLPDVRHVLDVRYGEWRVPDVESWPERLAQAAPEPPSYEPVTFDHPLVVLFSSGTTGPPKAIVHGHGGLLLEHLKNHAFSWDLGPDDRMLWFTTTSWMMWNALVSALLTRSSIVVVDGNPVHPDLGWQWRLAGETGATVMGASPGFVMACREQDLELRAAAGPQLRIVGSAGAPLPPEGAAWLVERLGDGITLNVGSGGTDVCSALVQDNPLLPSRAGLIGGRALGVAAHAWDDDGHELVDELGELVVTRPMPSMPVGFWGDDDGSRLHAAYFDHFPGTWRHGDWVVFGADGSCRVAGRSDATLNRGGVRLGTAEFYRVVEELPGVADSLVVHLEDAAGGNGELLLVVVPSDGRTLDEALERELRTALRTELSPRHVPDTVVAVPVVPRNLTGKKLELPVKRILQGTPADQVASRDALADPTALDAFVELAQRRGVSS